MAGGGRKICFGSPVVWIVPHFSRCRAQRIIRAVKEERGVAKVILHSNRFHNISRGCNLIMPPRRDVILTCSRNIRPRSERWFCKSHQTLVSLCITTCVSSRNHSLCSNLEKFLYGSTRLASIIERCVLAVLTDYIDTNVMECDFYFVLALDSQRSISGNCIR